MCTTTLSHLDDVELSAPIHAGSGASTAGEDLFDHLIHCVDCLLTITQQRKPLSVGGCSRFQQLFAATHRLYDCERSPLKTVHVSPEVIEEYYFRRLMPVEKLIFEAHVRLCSRCATDLHNELMLLHAMKAALSEDTPFYRDRNGATFAVGAST